MLRLLLLLLPCSGYRHPHGNRPLRCTRASLQPASDEVIAGQEISAFLAREYGNSGTEWAVTRLAPMHALSPNECFKATSREAAAAAAVVTAPVFVKRSKGVPDSFPQHRLRYEFEGMRAFARYSKGLIAEPLMYSDAQQVLVTEWLAGYVPLSSFFGFAGPAAAVQALDVGLDVYQAMGTAMGRAHARTHKACLDDAQRIALAARFNNPEPFAAWDAHLFAPTMRAIEGQDGAGDDVLQLLRRYNAARPGASQASGSGALTDAVSRLRHTYLGKKESLVHADLHSNNVLVRPPGRGDGARRDRDDRQPFKVVNFEKCACGPAGLDLGMFLASFLWYYPGHSDPSWRRGLAGGVLAVIDAYRQAFKVQITGAGGVARTRSVAIDVDAILDEVLVDALGFMGLYALFMAVHGSVAAGDDAPIEVLPLGGMPELSFGDTAGRLAAVRRRQAAMSVHALLLYLDHTLDANGSDSGWRGCGVSAQSFAAVFAADDKTLQRGMDHATEFWY